MVNLNIQCLEILQTEQALQRPGGRAGFPLTKINRSAYQALSNKTEKGLPTQYWVQRFIDKVTITLYLAPGSNEAGNTINYFYVKRIKEHQQKQRDEFRKQKTKLGLEALTR